MLIILNRLSSSRESAVGGMKDDGPSPALDLRFSLYLSHSVGEGTPCCLHPADGSRRGGSRRHRGPQQAKDEAGSPGQPSAPHRYRRKRSDQRGDQRRLRSPPLQRLVKSVEFILRVETRPAAVVASKPKCVHELCFQTADRQNILLCLETWVELI